METILILLLIWYCIYRLSRDKYKRRTGKELKFKDTFKKPKNWDDM